MILLCNPSPSVSLQTHRLRAGAVPWRGRLEVKKDGVWGTVHDSMFGSEEANVACRAAGYGSAVSVQSGSSYGRGIGPVHYQDTRSVTCAFQMIVGVGLKCVLKRVNNIIMYIPLQRPPGRGWNWYGKYGSSNSLVALYVAA